MKNKSWFVLLMGGIAAVVILCSDNATQAQVRVGVGVPGRGWYRPTGYGYGWGYGGWGYNPGASTVAGGYGQGMAEVIRAQGEANQSNAQARLTLEEARTKDIENDKKAADAYWAMRNRWRQEREAQRQENAERAARNRERLASEDSGPRNQGLGPDAFDSVTGQINWPPVLQTPQFDEYRAELNELFEHRTLVGAASGRETSQQIKATTDAMRDELKEQITQMSPDDYIAARKFIDGLAYEGRS